MFKDMQVSNTIMEEFKTHVNNQNMTLSGVDLSVRILTTGFWPTQSSTPNCTIPISPREAFEAFKRFYLAKHSGRQLTLQPQLGEYQVESCFRLKRDISRHSRNCIHECCFLRYEVGSWQWKWSRWHRKRSRNLFDHWHNYTTNKKTCLASLHLSGKLRQKLSGSPRTKINKKYFFYSDVRSYVVQHSWENDIRGNPTRDRHTRKGSDSCTSISVNGKTPTAIATQITENEGNWAFEWVPCQWWILLKTSQVRMTAKQKWMQMLTRLLPLHRVKIQTVAAKGETEPERRETRNKVDEDRKHEIEAAIVRIMKSRKKLSVSFCERCFTENFANLISAWSTTYWSLMSQPNCEVASFHHLSSLRSASKVWLNASISLEHRKTAKCIFI